MFAASIYEEIEKREREVPEKEIVVLLFVRPTNDDSMNIIREFEYIHFNAGKYCSVYAVGYTDDITKADNSYYRRIHSVLDADWYFSDQAFVDFKDRLERRIRWKYSGENEVLILQNNPGSINSLNFQNYVAIDINHGIREGYIDSFQAFMESLIRSARANVTAKDAIRGIVNERISVKGIVADAINESKTVPLPIKKIIKDRLFYRSARNNLGV